MQNQKSDKKNKTVIDKIWKAAILVLGDNSHPSLNLHFQNN